MSRMDILSEQEINTINNSSDLVRKYSRSIDRESAYEILNAKIEAIEKQAAEKAAREKVEDFNGSNFEKLSSFLSVKE